MKPLRFEWDEGKDRENRRKHGVSFAEAQTVFFDENAVEFYDDGHSGGKIAFFSSHQCQLRALLICHCCARRFGCSYHLGP